MQATLVSFFGILGMLLGIVVARRGLDSAIPPQKTTPTFWLGTLTLFAGAGLFIFSYSLVAFKR